MKPKALILTGYGINAEKELKWAFDLAGAEGTIVHLEDLIENKKMINDYQILGFPGGFSFGDHIASGKVFANLVKYNLFEEVKNFIAADKLVIGICNGFQVITKLGLVPSFDNSYEPVVSLIDNDSGKFEDRWVYLDVENDKSPWLKGLKKLYVPVRHGEGKLVARDNDVLERLKKNGQVALRYTTVDGSPVEYPANPNGSVYDIAGITNEKGNVLGLMPHPEAYISKELHPRWTEGIVDEHTGLDIFKNAVAYFK